MIELSWLYGEVRDYTCVILALFSGMLFGIKWRLSDNMADAIRSKVPVGGIAVLVCFVAAIFAFFYFDIQTYLTLSALRSNRDRLLAYTEVHYMTTVLAFAGIYCLQTALSLPGAAILTLAGGLLFGSVLGAVYVNIAATSGATLAFLAARWLFRDWVERRFGQHLDPIQKGFARNALSYLIMLRLIPLFPFFLVNLVSGLTRIRLSTYMIATSIGILPGSFVYTNAGRQLGMIDSLSDIASPRVLGALTLLALLALLPVFYKRRMAGGADGVPSEAEGSVNHDNS